MVIKLSTTGAAGADSTGAEVEDKFPLSKLKVVKKTIEKESFEVEKIFSCTKTHRLRFGLKRFFIY